MTHAENTPKQSPIHSDVVSAKEPGLRQVVVPDAVAVGTVPELGVVPARMHAYAIRAERFGEPTTSFKSELLETWEPGPGEVGETSAPDSAAPEQQTEENAPVRCRPKA